MVCWLQAFKGFDNSSPKTWFPSTPYWGPISKTGETASSNSKKKKKPYKHTHTHTHVRIHLEYVQVETFIKIRRTWAESKTPNAFKENLREKRSAASLAVNWVFQGLPLTDLLGLILNKQFVRFTKKRKKWKSGTKMLLLGRLFQNILTKQQFFWR